VASFLEQPVGRLPLLALQPDGMIFVRGTLVRSDIADVCKLARDSTALPSFQRRMHFKAQSNAI